MTEERLREIEADLERGMYPDAEIGPGVTEAAIGDLLEEVERLRTAVAIKDGALDQCGETYSSFWDAPWFEAARNADGR